MAVQTAAALEPREPPIVPGKIICVGLNYRDHAVESGLPIPRYPLLFAKLPSSFVGSGFPIRLPSISGMVDFEAELGVVTGRPRKRSAPTGPSNMCGVRCA